MLDRLPIVKAQIGVATGADLVFGLTVIGAEGAALSLHGLDFRFSIWRDDCARRIVTKARVENNRIEVRVAAARLSRLRRGAYRMRLLAADGAHTRDVFSWSTLSIGKPSPLMLAPAAG